MAYVNLWECLTSLDRTDRPVSDEVREVLAECGKTHGFGNELSLTVNDGVWKIKVFNCYDQDYERYVELTIWPHGRVSVTRKVDSESLSEVRTISF